MGAGMDQDVEVREAGRVAPAALSLQTVGALAGRSADLARRLPFIARLAPRARGADLELASEPRARPSLYKLSFYGLVLAPAFLVIAYLAFLASDQFVSEARFAVRAAPGVSTGGADIKASISSLIGGGGGGLGGQDAFIVTSYIRSRAIIADIAPLIDLRAVFRRPEADFWARLKKNASAEELIDYWNSMVQTDIDAPSGIVTVHARAFRPEDALELVRAIITLSEKLVNDVSARARADTMRRAESEVRRSEGLVRAALQDMRQYRETEGFLNPLTAAASTSQLLMQSMSDKIRMENDLFVASRAMSPNAPTLRDAKVRLEAIDNQIAQLKAKLTGDSQEGRTVSASLVRFEELELKRIFSEKLFSMAQDSLERSRIAAERQNVYVSVFVPPSLPEYSRYPERLGYSIVIPLTLLVIWGIAAMIVATVEDHRI